MALEHSPQPRDSILVVYHDIYARWFAVGRYVVVVRPPDRHNSYLTVITSGEALGLVKRLAEQPPRVELPLGVRSLRANDGIRGTLYLRLPSSGVRPTGRRRRRRTLP